MVSYRENTVLFILHLCVGRVIIFEKCRSKVRREDEQNIEQNAKKNINKILNSLPKFETFGEFSDQNAILTSA
jgi:hypothetical protein